MLEMIVALVLLLPSPLFDYHYYLTLLKIVWHSGEESTLRLLKLLLLLLL